MKSVSLILGIVCTVLSILCLVLLIKNVSGDCSSVTNLMCCIGFIIFSVLGADGCYKSFKGSVSKK